MKKIFIVPGVLVSIIILFFAYLIWLDKVEKDDWGLANDSREIGEQLVQYKQEQGHLPDTLKQAGIQEKVCVTFKCVTFHYKVLDNGQEFTLAANLSTYYVVIYDGTSGKGSGSWGLETFDEFKKYVSRNSTPSAWPEVFKKNLEQ